MRLSPLQSNLMRLNEMTAITSNGSGIAAGYIYNDPTSTFGNYTEHVSYLANLYTEYKIVRVRWTFSSSITGGYDGKTASAVPLAIGVFLRTPSSLPTVVSANQVLDNTPSWLWNIANDTSPLGFKKTCSFSNRNIGYQLTTTSSTDYAGAPGGLLYYGTNLPAGQIVAFVACELWIRYRARS
jgi:hypothetical protein